MGVFDQWRFDDFEADRDFAALLDFVRVVKLSESVPAPVRELLSKDDFMWMGCCAGVIADGVFRGDRVAVVDSVFGLPVGPTVHAYKHISTRRYLHLDVAGHLYGRTFHGDTGAWFRLADIREQLALVLDLDDDGASAWWAA